MNMKELSSLVRNMHAHGVAIIVYPLDEDHFCAKSFGATKTTPAL
jgi:hypothetical protein